jgi:hypothetical protein
MQQDAHIAVVEVGECAKEKLKEIAHDCLSLDALYYWPYEEEKPLCVVIRREPGYDPDRLKLRRNHDE